MKITKNNIVGSCMITLDKFEDERGFFIESFNEQKFTKEIGFYEFVQDNHSKSKQGVLRGLHYQVKHPQGKLVRCTQGSIFDVIVDLRVNSPSYKEHFTITLQKPEEILWVPPGLAHGFYNLAETSEFEYKGTDYYYPEDERTLIFSCNVIANVLLSTSNPNKVFKLPSTSPPNKEDTSPSLLRTFPSTQLAISIKLFISPF